MRAARAPLRWVKVCAPQGGEDGHAASGGAASRPTSTRRWGTTPTRTHTATSEAPSSTNRCGAEYGEAYGPGDVVGWLLVMSATLRHRHGADAAADQPQGRRVSGRGRARSRRVVARRGCEAGPHEWRLPRRRVHERGGLRPSTTRRASLFTGRHRHLRSRCRKFVRKLVCRPRRRAASAFAATPPPRRRQRADARSRCLSSGWIACVLTRTRWTAPPRGARGPRRRRLAGAGSMSRRRGLRRTRRGARRARAASCNRRVNLR